MSIVFKRYDVSVTSLEGIEEDAEGEYVKAQDAYDKCAVLSAEITTLKAQLKDAQCWQRLYMRMAETLGPAWDYIQANPDKFGAIPGDDKTTILVESFMKSHKD